MSADLWFLTAGLAARLGVALAASAGLWMATAWALGRLP